MKKPGTSGFGLFLWFSQITLPGGCDRIFTDIPKVSRVDTALRWGEVMKLQLLIRLIDELSFAFGVDSSESN